MLNVCRLAFVMHITKTHKNCLRFRICANFFVLFPIDSVDTFIIRNERYAHCSIVYLNEITIEDGKWHWIQECYGRTKQIFNVMFCFVLFRCVSVFFFQRTQSHTMKIVQIPLFQCHEKETEQRDRSEMNKVVICMPMHFWSIDHPIGTHGFHNSLHDIIKWTHHYFA